MSDLVCPGRYPVQANILPIGHHRQRPGPRRAKLNVVVPNGHFTGLLYVMELDASNSSETKLRKLRLFHNESVTTRWTRFLQATLLCRRTTIETAVLEINETATPVRIVSSLPIPDRNAEKPSGLKLTIRQNRQAYPITIVLPASKPSRHLTSAFHQHSLPPTPLLEGPANALVLRPALDKTRLGYMLVFALAMAPAAAVVVAWHTKKIDTGISVCICIFVMVSTVQTIVAWAQVI